MSLLAGCGSQRATAPVAAGSPPPGAATLRRLAAVTSYKYPAGTVLAARAARGKFSLVKVLRVERLETDDNYNGTIIVHFRTYDDLFPSLAAATKAASSPHLKVRVASGTAGQDFLAHGVQRIATVPVRDDELAGYRQWRQKYEAGQSDVFPL